MFAFGETVTILRPSDAGVNAYGDPNTSTTSRIDIPGCGIAPRYSTEPSERDRRGVVIGLELYAPFGSDIRPTDRIEINGGGTDPDTHLALTPSTALIYEIEGEPGSWKNPHTGTKFGVEVSLKRAIG